MNKNNVRAYKKPEWLALFEEFENEEYGETITYGELNHVLMDGDVRTDKRWVFERFKKQLLKERNKALENVRTEGYRIVNPKEHIRLSNREIVRAQRRAKQGVDLILNVAYDLLSDRDKAQLNLHATRVQGIYISLIGETKALKESEKHFTLPEIPRT